ncbi:MAG: UvrD-helicase domain-containing protein [Deltaproteobacteria bacterium]|nr:UvrD-helicase domain-containing protein [Deltaproteobacteria bacterium]
MKLTRNQKLAIESIDRPTAIIAGAGSGKTEVLIGRLLHILKNQDLELGQILCATFTEKSALELKRRIARHLSEKMKLELPFSPIGTFHGFFLNLIKEHASHLGLSEWVSVMDEHTAKLTLHKHCRRGLLDALQNRDPNAMLLTEALEFKQALLLLEELMQFRWHAGRCLKVPGSFLPRATENLYQKILAAYTLEKRERQSLDFQDFEILALELLRNNKDVLQKTQRRFQHILVDEAQDINDLQREILELLFQPKQNCLCIVGDPKQSIYRFRGANWEGFNKIVNKIREANGHLIDLKENFRSRPPILDFVNHTFAPLFSSQESAPLVATREEAPETGVEILAVASPPKTSKEGLRKREAEEITKYIQSLVREKKARFGDIALLFQALSDTRFYEEAFRNANIPYRLFGGRGFLNAQEVIDLLFVLKLMVKLEDRLALVGLMRSPLIGFDDLFITELCQKHPADLGKTLLALPEAAWLKALTDQKQNWSGAEILQETVMATRYDCLVDKLDPSGTQLANIEQLIELTRRLESEEEMSLADILEYYEELKKRRAPLANAPVVNVSSEACQLMTVHAAKGLQFPIVILPDLMRASPVNSNRFLFVRDGGLGFALKEDEKDPFSPFVPTPEMTALKEIEKNREYAERKRLFYVALTRAREKLVIVWHDEVRQSSLWYGWLKESIDTFKPIPHWQAPKFSKHVIPAKAGIQFLDPDFRRDDVISMRQKEIPHYTVTELAHPVILSPKGAKNPVEHRRDVLNGTALGNLVHAVLKQMDGLEHSQLKGLIQRKIFELEMIVSDAETEEVEKLLRHFLEGNTAPPTWKGLHELPFQLQTPQALITGVIDYLWETDAGWIVCDFKTDQKIEPEKYQFQMDTYALALSRALAKPVLESRLLYLKHNKAHVEPCSQARLARASEELIKRVDSFRIKHLKT